MNLVHLKTKFGFVDDGGGYIQGLCSWWRDYTENGKWYICGHSGFFKSSYAVVDDFGNLVAVES